MRQSWCLWLKYHDLYWVCKPSVAHKGVQKPASRRGKSWILLRELCTLGWRGAHPQASHRGAQELSAGVVGSWGPRTRAAQPQCPEAGNQCLFDFISLICGSCYSPVDSAVLDLVQFQWSKLRKYPTLAMYYAVILCFLHVWLSHCINCVSVCVCVSLATALHWLNHLFRIHWLSSAGYY